MDAWAVGAGVVYRAARPRCGERDDPEGRLAEFVRGQGAAGDVDAAAGAVAVGVGGGGERETGGGERCESDDLLHALVSETESAQVTRLLTVRLSDVRR